MDDLISRQAAIDALGERPMVWMDSDYEIAERNQYDMDKLAIETVPSAQPKVEQQWIPCSETVDIPDHEILACNKYGQEMFGYLTYEDEQWLCASDNCVLYDPIAWREKPEPYREEGGAG